MRCRISCDRYTYENVETSATIMAVIARTSLVFRRMERRTQTAKRWGGRNLRLRRRSRRRARRRRRRTVFLQLIMQGFQADSEDFGRPRLVVVGGFQRLHD